MIGIIIRHNDKLVFDLASSLFIINGHHNIQLMPFLSLLCIKAHTFMMLDSKGQTALPAIGTHFHDIRQ